MTSPPLRVDFYVLAAADPGARLRFACRLAEQVYTLHALTYAHVGSAAEARQFDELLWTFRDGSFVPHEIASSRAEQRPPVVIGHAADTDVEGDLLINLTDTIPSFFDRFGRIAEVVDASDQGKQAGRQRFSFYRDNGHEPNTHKMA
ncbi:MAG: DNA polymerase III subunit chi [Gammaproteobacteria bacterium]